MIEFCYDPAKQGGIEVDKLGVTFYFKTERDYKNMLAAYRSFLNELELMRLGRGRIF